MTFENAQKLLAEGGRAQDRISKFVGTLTAIAMYRNRSRVEISRLDGHGILHERWFDIENVTSFDITITHKETPSETPDPEIPPRAPTDA